jgi:hypothetical protein
METKVTGSGAVASNRERGQNSSWTAAPADEEGNYTYHPI